MERTRAWYAAQGYQRPYQWATFEDVPFERLAKPLSECRVGVVTTAGQIDADGRPVLPKRVYSGSVDDLPARFYTEDLAWDRIATHLDDRETFLPLGHLEALAAAGHICSLAPRFHGVPTEYSQRRTLEVDAPEILERLREDQADVALLVPL
jgi:hypothetical protein